MPGERERGKRSGRSAEAERRLEHDDEADREYTTPERARALDEESPTGRPAPSPEGRHPRRK